MRDSQKLMAGLMMSVALATGIQARINPPRDNRGVAANGPYHAISDRNIFGLAHKEDLVTNEPPPPPPGVKLIGLMMIAGKLQGVFSISEQGVVGKAPATYIMGAEERQAGVDVLSLNLAGKTANVRVGENATTLKLEEPKPVTTGVVIGGAPAVPRAGLPGARGPGFPTAQPGFGGGQSGFNNNSAALPAYNPNAGFGANGAGTDGAGMMGDGGVLPNRPVRSDSQSQASVEQQINNMEAQRTGALEAGRSDIASLLPITAMTPPSAILQMNGLAPNTDSTGQQQQTTTSGGTPQPPSPFGSKGTGTMKGLIP